MASNIVGMIPLSCLDKLCFFLMGHLYALLKLGEAPLLFSDRSKNKKVSFVFIFRQKLVYTFIPKYL